jgi:hypothetical protein
MCVSGAQGAAAGKPVLRKSWKVECGAQQLTLVPQVCAT